MQDKIILFTSYWQSIKDLPDEQLGKLMRAVFTYQESGEALPLDGILEMAFRFIRQQLDTNERQYKEKCEKNREAIRKRWKKKNTDVYERIQTNNKDTNEYERKKVIPNNNNKNNNNNNVSKDTIKEEEQSSSMSGSPDPEGKSDINFDELKKYFNEKMEGQLIPKIVTLSDRRKKSVRARVRESGKDAVKVVIDKSAASDFMNGKNSKGWVANFDWIFCPSGFEKILNGNYDNRDKEPKGAEKGMIIHNTADKDYTEGAW